ncbi:hypothetical protein V2J09_003518 [Rumex salicifolius]
MENMNSKQKGSSSSSSSSSIATDLFGPKATPSTSVFGSVFGPPPTDHNNTYYRQETTQPCHYSSSIYYGGQDDYSSPGRNTDKHVILKPIDNKHAFKTVIYCWQLTLGATNSVQEEPGRPWFGRKPRARCFEGKLVARVSLLLKRVFSGTNSLPPSNYKVYSSSTSAFPDSQGITHLSLTPQISFKKKVEMVVVFILVNLFFHAYAT